MKFSQLLNESKTRTLKERQYYDMYIGKGFDFYDTDTDKKAFSGFVVTDGNYHMVVMAIQTFTIKINGGPKVFDDTDFDDNGVYVYDGNKTYYSKK